LRQSDLCDAMFSFNWVRSGTSVSRQCFAFLLINLISANSCFLLPASKVLIECFVPHPSQPPPAASSSPATQAPSCTEQPPASDDDVNDLNLVHAIIKHIVSLVPRSVGVLVRVLNEQFPHKTQPLEVQVQPQGINAWSRVAGRRMLRLDALFRACWHVFRRWRI